MRILVLNQFFPPDLAPTGRMAADLAEDLAAAGHEVTAVASRGGYLGGARLPRRERRRGVEVVRLPATTFGKGTLLRRALDYASFLASASLALAALPRHDVVVALTTPPLVAAAALPARALRGSRLVCWVQDLYPDVAVAFGALRAGSPAARAMRAVSRAVLRRADRVVALGEAMRERCLAAGAAPERTVVLPNWADPEEIRPAPHARNPLRAALAPGAETLVLYSGNLGRAHDLETPLAAARLLRDRRDVAFLFVGDGARRAEVERAARELPNVRLEPYRPREELADSLSAGDVHLVTLAPGLLGRIEPSKAYAAMAAGRPAVYVGPPGSEVARTLLAEGCGVAVPSGDAEGLARAVAHLASDPARRAAMGERGRRAVEERLGRAAATARFRALLEELAPPARAAHLRSA